MKYTNSKELSAWLKETNREELKNPH